MAWWHAFGIGRGRLPQPDPPPAAQETLTSAATPVRTPRSELIRNTDGWQEEAWGFYDTLGEFRYAVDWEASMLSRVRLYAGKLEPGQDEPVPAKAGLAVDLITELGGGVAGRAQLMAGLSTQLSVPGEGYLIGEETGGIEQWTVRSIDEIRVARGRFEVADETTVNGTRWRPLGANSLVNRVHRSHKRWHHIADSPARAARSTMRELELVNRYILSQYLSRLASAGVLVLPSEVTFPVREEFADAPDPFVAEWVEIAAESIQNPGTAAAVVPIPMKVPAEYVDKIRHVDFTLKLDDKILDKRESAIKRLASQLNMPPEVLLGMGDLNHWGAWQVDEAALKTNIAPDAELIVQALTRGYLQPRLKASRVEDWARWVVWYDMSELALRPDHSENAIQLYDRLEINGAALRRETGFNDSDKPTDAELEEQALKVIIHTLPSGAGSALSQLIGKQVVIAPAAPIDATEQPTPEGDANTEQTPAERPLPGTRNDAPPAQDAARTAAAAARTARLTAQAQALHAVRFATARAPELLHPQLCTDGAYSCPFSHAALKLASLPRPGTSGVYEARLDPFGRLTIGRPAPHLDAAGFIPTRIPTRSPHGYAHGRR